jgi:hypothetical protein
MNYLIPRSPHSTLSVLTTEEPSALKVRVGPSAELNTAFTSGQTNVSLLNLSQNWNFGGLITASYPGSLLVSGYQKQEPNLSPALATRLNALSTLKNGWDEGGALPISPEAVNAARNALRRVSLVRPFQDPSIVPTFDGFLQIEWHSASRSLEFEYTPNEWSILGVASANTGDPRYYPASAPLVAVDELEKFYIWFSTGELIWPSR